MIITIFSKYTIFFLSLLFCLSLLFLLFILFHSFLWLKIRPALFYLSFGKVYGILFPFFFYTSSYFSIIFEAIFLSILISKFACCFQFSIVLHHSISLFTTNYSIILVFLRSYIFSSIHAFYTLFLLLYLFRFNSFYILIKKTVFPFLVLFVHIAFFFISVHFLFCTILVFVSYLNVVLSFYFSPTDVYTYFFRSNLVLFFSSLFDLLSFSLVWHNSYLLSPDLFWPKCLIDFSRTAISSYILQSLWCASLLSLWLVGHNKKEELHNKQEKKIKSAKCWNKVAM